MIFGQQLQAGILRLTIQALSGEVEQAGGEVLTVHFPDS
jgi:hypothetical protein